MQYETAAQMAERLGVTVRMVQLWAKEGKLPGAMKQGRDWLIPIGMAKPKRGTIAEGEAGVPLPLLAGAYSLGTIFDTISAMPEGDEKNLALSEYYYFTGQPQKAVEKTETFFNHKDVVTKLSACLVYSFASIALGEEKHAKRGFDCIETALKVELDAESMSPRNMAICQLIGATVNVLMHRIPPQAELSEYMKYLPRGLQVWACCMLAHVAFLHREYNKAIGITETILSLCTKIYPVAMAYIYIVGAMSYMELKQVEKAKQYVFKAWEFASPDSLMQPFGEHHGLLCGLVETCIKKSNPNEYNKIIKIANEFTANWRKVHNAATENEITTALTTTEFAISMLAGRGWSNKEIAEYMELSLHTVKRYISIVYQKLSITSRAELKKYMH